MPVRAMLPFRAHRERWFPSSARVFVSRKEFVVLWADRCHRVWSGGLFPFLSDDGDEQRAEVWQVLHGGPMKRKERTQLKGGLVHASADEFVKSFPLLGEFLTSARFDDSDETRESPTVTVWASGGQWKMSIRDRAEGLVMWLSADTVRELVKMANGFCQDTDGPWRVDDQSHANNGKRVKKS